jgi:hypothetical protein
MTVSYPGDPVIEPVGAGIGSLLVHRTARRLAPHFLDPDRSDAVLSPTQGAARIG